VLCRGHNEVVGADQIVVEADEIIRKTVRCERAPQLGLNPDTRLTPPIVVRGSRTSASAVTSSLESRSC